MQVINPIQFNSTQVEVNPIQLNPMQFNPSLSGRLDRQVAGLTAKSVKTIQVHSIQFNPIRFWYGLRFERYYWLRWKLNSCVAPHFSFELGVSASAVFSLHSSPIMSDESWWANANDADNTNANTDPRFITDLSNPLWSLAEEEGDESERWEEESEEEDLDKYRLLYYDTPDYRLPIFLWSCECGARLEYLSGGHMDCVCFDLHELD